MTHVPIPLSRRDLRRTALFLRWPLIIGLVVLVGYLDHATGEDLIFSFFYLFPVAAAAWWFGWRFGLLTSLLCAFEGWFTLWASGSPSGGTGIAAWNAVLRLAIFVSFALLLHGFHRKIQQLDRMAFFDLSTGILNSRGFYLKAQEALLDTPEQKQPVTIAYIDLDNFKQVNDRFGHAEGDRLLRLVAETLEDRCTGEITVARMGGDEFILFAIGILPPELEKCIQGLRSALNGRMQAEGWPVTFSIGAVCHAQAPGSVEDLVREADDLMYQVKKAGKNALKMEIR